MQNNNKISIFIPSDRDCITDLKLKVELLKPLIDDISIKKNEYGCEVLVFEDKRISNDAFGLSLQTVLLTHNPKIIFKAFNQLETL